MEKLIENLVEIREDIDWATADNLVEDRELSSFDIIQIVGMIKDEYGKKVPVREIKQANFNSAVAIKELIDRI